MAGAAARRSRCCTSRCRKPKRSCAPWPRRTAGSLDGINIRELTPAEGALDPDEQNTMFHPSEIELATTTQAHPGGRRAPEAHARRVRLAVGAAAAGRQRRCATGGRSSRSSSSSPTRECTVLLLDDLTASRSRPADAEHRARRHPARAAEPRVRRRAPPAARRQVPRRPVSRRLSRLRHPARAASRCSRGWSRPNIGSRRHARKAGQRISPSWTRCSAAASRKAPAR